jgi:hypothetical protein
MVFVLVWHGTFCTLLDFDTSSIAGKYQSLVWTDLLGPSDCWIWNLDRSSDWTILYWHGMEWTSQLLGRRDSIDSRLVLVYHVLLANRTIREPLLQ